MASNNIAISASAGTLRAFLLCVLGFDSFPAAPGFYEHRKWGHHYARSEAGRSGGEPHTPICARVAQAHGEIGHIPEECSV